MNPPTNQTTPKITKVIAATRAILRMASVHVYRENQQRDSYQQCEDPCFRHPRLENGFPRALGIETDIDYAPTRIPLHNGLGKISHCFVHPGTFGNSVSTKTLSTDFVLIDYDRTIERQSPTKNS